MNSQLTIHDYIDQLFADKDLLYTTLRNVGDSTSQQTDTFSQLVPKVMNIQHLLFNNTVTQAQLNNLASYNEYWWQKYYVNAYPKEVTVAANFTGTEFLREFCAGLMTTSIPKIIVPDTIVDRYQSYGMEAMYSGCKNVTSIDVSGINPTGVIKANSMFSGCRSLQHLDLDSMPCLPNIQDATAMLNSCWSLTGTLKITKFRDVKSLSSFCGGTRITTLDLSESDLSHLTTMGNIFYGSSAESIKVIGQIPGDTNLAGFVITNSSVRSLDLSQLTFLNDEVSTGSISNFTYRTKDMTFIDIRNFERSDIGNMLYVRSSQWDTYGIPWDCVIVVKNTNMKQLVTQAHPKLTHVYTVEEWEARNNG